MIAIEIVDVTDNDIPSRVCCNCRHNIRIGEDANIQCHCDVDGHFIGYIACFNHWCRKWAKDHKFEEVDYE